MFPSRVSNPKLAFTDDDILDNLRLLHLSELPKQIGKIKAKVKKITGTRTIQSLDSRATIYS
jgi:hypothetical protein